MRAKTLKDYIDELAEVKTLIHDMSQKIADNIKFFNKTPSSIISGHLKEQEDRAIELDGIIKNHPDFKRSVPGAVDVGGDFLLVEGEDVAGYSPR